MGKYVVPAILLVIGFGAAWAGWKFMEGSMAGVRGTGVRGFRMGQVSPRQLTAESEYYKWKTGEAIIDQLG